MLASCKSKILSILPKKSYILSKKQRAEIQKDVRRSRRPSRNQFKQQKLATWLPSYNHIIVGQIFFAYSLLCLLISGCLFVNYSLLFYRRFEYTSCMCSTINNESNPHSSITILNDSCILKFHLNKKVALPVNVYYGLSNFYQNYRYFVNSRDWKQLYGKTITEPDSNCQPFAYKYPSNNTGIYGPCGLIANSRFNDTIRMYYDSTVQINWTSSGIAWIIDKFLLFGVPDNWNGTEKPANWPEPAYVITPNAYQGDNDLIVWMRTASTPNFLKFFRIIGDDDNVNFAGHLPAGDYHFQITQNFPVEQFYGGKYLTLTQSSPIGGKNNYIPTMFLVLGTVQLAIAFYLIQLSDRSDDCGNVNFRKLVTENVLIIRVDSSGERTENIEVLNNRRTLSVDSGWNEAMKNNKFKATYKPKLLLANSSLETEKFKSLTPRMAELRTNSSEKLRTNSFENEIYRSTSSG